MLVDQEVVEGCPISYDLSHAIGDHGYGRIRVQLDVRVSQIVLVESVYELEFVWHLGHRAYGKKCTGVLVKVITEYCQLVSLYRWCMWLPGIATATACVNLSHEYCE